MAGLVSSTLAKAAMAAEAFDAGHAARTFLAKTCLPMWCAACAFEYWHMEGGPDWAGGLVGIAVALAMTGTLIACIRHHFRKYSGDPARLLLEALLTIPPQQRPDLRAVSGIGSASRSSTPAPRQTTH